MEGEAGTVSGSFIITEAKEEEEMPYSQFLENGSACASCMSLKDPHRLSYMAACLFANVLADTIQAINILVECNNVIRIQKTMVSMQNLLETKHGVSHDQKEDIVVHYPLTSWENKLRKMGQDKQYFKDTITDLYFGLCKNGSFDWFISYLDLMDYEHKKGQILYDEMMKNKAHRNELKKQLRLMKNVHKSVSYDTDIIIARLKAAFEDEDVTFFYKNRFTVKYQNSIIEQQALSFEKEERFIEEKISSCKKRTDSESRVHSEVDLYSSIVINETIDNIDKWMSKYEEDIGEMELKVYNQRKKYNEQVDKRQAMEDKSRKRELEMESWLKFKKDRENEIAYKEKMKNSALIVQAWWRGFILRHKLGPYRPKKVKKMAKSKLQTKSTS